MTNSFSNFPMASSHHLENAEQNPTDALLDDARTALARGDEFEIGRVKQELEIHLQELKGYSPEDAQNLRAMERDLQGANIPPHKRAGFLDSAVAELRQSSGSLSEYARERISDFAGRFLPSSRRGDRQQPAFYHPESTKFWEIRTMIHELETASTPDRSIRGIQNYIRGSLAAVLAGKA